MTERKRIGAVSHQQEEWSVDVIGDRVLISRYAGPFGLPAGEVTIFGGCAASLAKVLTKAATETKRFAPTLGANHG